MKKEDVLKLLKNNNKRISQCENDVALRKVQCSDNSKRVELKVSKKYNNLYENGYMNVGYDDLTKKLYIVPTSESNGYKVQKQTNMVIIKFKNQDLYDDVFTNCKNAFWYKLKYDDESGFHYINI